MKNGKSAVAALPLILIVAATLAVSTRSMAVSYTNPAERSIAEIVFGGSGTSIGPVKGYEWYTVSGGDTLWSLARSRGTTPEKIGIVNGFRDLNVLRAGEMILLPIPEKREPFGLPASPASPSVSRPRGTLSLSSSLAMLPVSMSDYAVVEGDNLWSIAGKTGITIDTLLGCNIVARPERIMPGTVLKIPSTDGILHLVTSTTSIPRLSEYYDVSESDIMSANRLTPASVLVPGIYLFIPGEHSSGKEWMPAPSTREGRVVSQGKVKISYRPPLASIYVTSKYGYRKDPFNGKKRLHTGVDLRAPVGTPVMASMDGTVVHAGKLGGYGMTVVVDHGRGLETLYGHCSRINVKRGQNVKAGQTIALAGFSGRSTGPHLHFEVRRNGKAINPGDFLKKGQMER